MENDLKLNYKLPWFKIRRFKDLKNSYTKSKKYDLSLSILRNKINIKIGIKYISNI